MDSQKEKQIDKEINRQMNIHSRKINILTDRQIDDRRIDRKYIDNRWIDKQIYDRKIEDIGRQIWIVRQMD